MKLSELTAVLKGRLIGGDAVFEQLNTDTRSLQHGQLFVALKGDHFDGHHFVSTAINAGACALVVEREIEDVSVPQMVVEDTVQALGKIAAYKRAHFAGLIASVTGSSGKTTVKGFLREIFAVTHSVIATQGNFNNHIGVPLTLMKLGDEQFGVIEIGTNHPGEIEYLTQLVKPEIALVNNVSSAHIEGFGSIEAIAQEKAKIYSSLESAQTAVINLDDVFAQFFIDLTQGCSQVGYSIHRQSAAFPVVHCQNVRMDALGRAEFSIVFNDAHVQTTLQIPGQHNVANALAATAVAIAAGCSLDDIAIGLSRFEGEKGRMQILKGPSDSHVIDDTYNANPGSVKAAIDYLASLPGKRLLVLGNLGELGAFAFEALRALGAYAKEKGLDGLITCGDVAKFSSDEFGSEARHFSDKPDLVKYLRNQLDGDTTVLIKGSRSARMEEVVQGLFNKQEFSLC